MIEGYNDKQHENKKIDDFKDILATPNDKKKLICNECDFTMLQNQALKSYNIEVIDMKEMREAEVDPHHHHPDKGNL